MWIFLFFQPLSTSVPQDTQTRGLIYYMPVPLQNMNGFHPHFPHYPQTLTSSIFKGLRRIWVFLFGNAYDIIHLLQDWPGT